MAQHVRGSTSRGHRPNGAVNPLRPPSPPSPASISELQLTYRLRFTSAIILTFQFIRHQAYRGRHGLPLPGRCLHHRSHRGGIVYVSMNPRCDLAANERVWILDLLFHGEGEAFNVRNLG